MKESSSASRSIYAARMHKVLAHIDQYLDTPLDLATLADVAHFSPDRLSAAWMGATPAHAIHRPAPQGAGVHTAAAANEPIACGPHVAAKPRL